MMGYNDLKDPSVSGFFRFLAKVGDNGMKMADREDRIWRQTMKYAGMPMGMWVLFAGSFQKQLTAYDLSFVVVVLQNFYSLLDNCIR